MSNGEPEASQDRAESVQRPNVHLKTITKPKKPPIKQKTNKQNTQKDIFKHVFF